MNYFKCIIVLALIGAASCCSTDADCTTPVDSTCNDGECTCGKGYFLSTTSSTCLPYVTVYNGDCSENAQCEWLGENSECYHEVVCRCIEGYRWYQGKCSKYVGLGEECSSSAECFDGYNLQSLTCLSGTCACTNDYYQRGDTDCRKKATNIGDICALDMDCQVTGTETACVIGKCKIPTSTVTEIVLDEVEETKTNFLLKIADVTSCQTNADCKDIENSECYNQTGTCICQKQYFFNEDGTKCIPEVGVDANCVEDSDCAIKPGKCENGVCYCRDYYFVGDGNRNCVKTISQNNWNCLSKEWCYAFGTYVYCSSSGTCNCSKIAELDSDNLLCIKKDDAPEGLCTSDVDCKHIENAYCIDEVCGCQEHFVLENDRCAPELGAPCDDNTPCRTENVCLGGTCQCTEHYVAFELECFFIKDHLGDDCEKDIQCSTGVTYSECTNSTCGCKEEHVAYNNACYQKTEYGSYCNNRMECTLSLKEMEDSVVCRNRKCQCPTGYTLKENECSSAVIIAGNFVVISVILVLKGVFSFFN